ncbi:hypothetical protein [Sphingobium sp.]|uniref:hypothetical protein n=1 Tax=Sphingobium sp. TaxID=1912891 RepID=UPI003BB53933
MTVLMGMDMYRKPVCRSAPIREASNGCFVTVGMPMPYEGVGNALRSTFAAARDSLPDDMLALLGKLDRH